MFGIPRKFNVQHHGRKVGRVQIEGSPIGEGSFGKVYKGKLNGREVAVKLFKQPLNASTEKIINRELGNLEKVQGLTRGLTLEGRVEYQQDGKTYVGIVTNLISGKNLGSILDDNKQTHFPEIARQLFYTLKRLHEFGIIHYDIKPENIMVDRKNQTWLIDFGVSREVTQKNLLQRGSAEYVAPEGFESEEYTPSLDLWATGATLFEAITGMKLVDVFHKSLKDIAAQQTGTELGLLASNALKNYENPDTVQEYMPYIISTFLQSCTFHSLEHEAFKVYDEVQKIMDQVVDRQDKPGDFQIKDLHLRELIKKLLRIDPKERISAFDALDSKFFDNSDICVVSINSPEQPIQPNSLGDKLMLLLIRLLDFLMISNNPKEREENQ